MDTKTIMHAIHTLRANTIGVYAAEHIPKILSPPAAFVTNLDTANKPGSHWIVIYIDKNGYGVYFDSYGLATTLPHHRDRLQESITKF